MLKDIFQRIFLLITQPAKTWALLAEENEEVDKLFSKYLYPIFGLIALTAFLGALISNQSMEIALVITIREFVSFFAGFYLASFALNELTSRMFKRHSLKHCQHFTAYSSSLIYTIAIADSLFGGLGLLYFFLPYTVYMIWEGAAPFMQVSEDKIIKFTIIASFVMLVPYMLAAIINRFMLTTPTHAG